MSQEIILSSNPEKKTFPGLSPLAFEHPLDAAALVALKKIPGIDQILRFVFRVIHEKRSRLHFLSSSVRVNERQFKHIYALYQEACEILDLEREPELFIAQDPAANAFAFGVDEPFIVLNSSLLDLMTPEEVQVVLAHELGHVFAGHMLYHSVLIVIWNLVQMGGFGIPFGVFGLQAFLVALHEWFRKSELTCDRAGLLVSQDIDTSLRVNMKLAGGRLVEHMDKNEFFKQADEYENQGDILDSFFKLMNNAYTTHPHVVARMTELQKWHDTGNYKDILAGNYRKRADDRDAALTDQWKEAAESYKKDMDESDDYFSKAMSGLSDVGENLVNAGSELFSKFFGGGRKKDDSKDDKNDKDEPSK